MTNPTIDELLEIYLQIQDVSNSSTTGKLLNSKFEALYSQLESKLADKPKCKYCDAMFDNYSQRDSHEITESYYRQIQSQHANLVKAIQEQIEKLEVQAIHQGRDFSDYDYQKLFLLKKIMSANEVKKCN